MRPLPHEALEQHREELKELAAEYGLTNVRVFGSARQGTDTAQSDLDTIVANPQVSWLSIKRMRDRLAHHYEATDYDAVWATLTVDRPRVRAAIASLRAEATDE